MMWARLLVKILMKNNLINDVANVLTQLSSITTLKVIDSAQAHSLEVANPEVIEAPPQQDNVHSNDEQMDTNVNIKDSSVEISSLESLTVSTNDLSTNTNRQTLDATNGNN